MNVRACPLSTAPAQYPNHPIDTLADVERRILPYPNSPIRFRTFPDARLSTGSHFRFVVSSCLKPNFPYAPFQNRRIKGLDLLADYLFTEPVTVIDTPDIAPASDNFAEIPISPNVSVNLKANVSVPAVPDGFPAALATESIVPIEFMLFLVNKSIALHDGRLTCHRAISYTPTYQFTMVIRHRRTVVCTGAIITALASARSTNDCVRLCILVHHVPLHNLGLQLSSTRMTTMRFDI